MSLWFYVVEYNDGWRIYTYSTGNTAYGRHWFATKEEADAFASYLVADGYVNHTAKDYAR